MIGVKAIYPLLSSWSSPWKCLRNIPENEKEYLENDINHKSTKKYRVELPNVVAY